LYLSICSFCSRLIWQSPEDVDDYNEGTYVVDIISQLLKVLKFGETKAGFAMRW